MEPKDDEKITGFVSVGMDCLKTPAMKISIANAFARDGRFSIIRSEERQRHAASQTLQDDLTWAIMAGNEPEIPGEIVPIDNDQAFTAFRNDDGDSSENDD